MLPSMTIQEEVADGIKDLNPSIREAIDHTLASRIPIASQEIYTTTWQDYQLWRSKPVPPITFATNSILIHGYLAQRW
jgi:hypothetical protein